MEGRARRKRLSPLQVAEEAIRKEDSKPSHLEVQHFGSKGRGIVTLSPLQKGDFVTYYHGRYVDGVPEGADDSYFFEVDMKNELIFIDASTEDGSFGRLINDSEKHFNSRPKGIEVDGRQHIAFFAIHDISKGEEITYNYGKSVQYWWRETDPGIRHRQNKEIESCASKAKSSQKGIRTPITQATKDNQRSASTVDKQNKFPELPADGENMICKDDDAKINAELRLAETSIGRESATSGKEMDNNIDDRSEEGIPKTHDTAEYGRSASTVDKQNKFPELPAENMICKDDDAKMNAELRLGETSIGRENATSGKEMDNNIDDRSEEGIPKTYDTAEYGRSASTVDKQNKFPELPAENMICKDDDAKINAELRLEEMSIGRENATSGKEMDNDIDDRSEEGIPKTNDTAEYGRSASTVDKQNKFPELPAENIICKDDDAQINAEWRLEETSIGRKKATSGKDMDNDIDDRSEEGILKTNDTAEHGRSISTVDKQNTFPELSAENMICKDDDAQINAEWRLEETIIGRKNATSGKEMDNDIDDRSEEGIPKTNDTAEYGTAGTLDRQKELPEQHADSEKCGPMVDYHENISSMEMDVERESSSCGEELDDDMDEDYTPDRDPGESEEDSDYDLPPKVHKNGSDEIKIISKAKNVNTQEITPQSQKTDKLPLYTETDRNQPDSSGNRKINDRYQNITIQPTSNMSGTRSWDKKHFCLFCDKGFAKLPQHLMGQHKDEPQVIEIELEKDPKVRKEKLAKLRKMGNHKHNCDVLRNGEGVLTVGYRPQVAVSPKEYGPCNECLVYLTRTNLWKHRCPAKKTNQEQEAAQRKRPALAAKLMMPTPENISPEVHQLLLSLKDDDIGRAVKGDILLVELAKYEYLEHGHDRDQHGDIRATLRRMGRLLLQLRKDTKESGNLSTFLDVTHFRAVVDAARQVSCFDESSHKYLKASTAIKIGHTLKRLAMIQKGKAMENQDQESQTRAQNFHELCVMNWSHEVSRHAHRTLHENKRNKVRVLPLTEDIMHMSQHLKERTVKCVELLKEKMNHEAWAKLNKVMLARIIVFNRRRSGESAKIKLEEYARRPRPNGDKVVMEGLSKVEQELCRSLERIEIRGKRGSNVPVLLTEEMVQAIDLLIKRRKEAGVCEGNEFLFARANYGSLGHIRGCDCLRELAKDAGCKNPSIMRSTPLRKQIATVSQIINLNENELDILAKFLGHDIRVHREFYRLPQETLQVAKVSKLLLASEQGLGGLDGKTLDEIDVAVDEEVPEEQEVVEDEDGSEEEDANEDYGDDFDGNTAEPDLLKGSGMSPEPVCKRRKHGKRTWTIEQKAAVMNHLGGYLAKRQLPGKNAIVNCIRQEPSLAHRTWRNIKDFCRNRMRTNDPLHL